MTFGQLEEMAALYNVYIRTGCVCNPGACQTYLNISQEKLIRHYEAGHTCGDAIDLVDGHPTGSVRVSFGYMSTYEDADKALSMIRDCFVEGQPIVDTSWLRLLNYTQDFDSYVDEFEQTSSSNEDLRKVHSSDNVSTCQIRIPLQSHLYLTDIIIYPIKSCAGMKVAKWATSPTGFKYDRAWMIVDQSGITMTQKRLPKLNLLKPFVDLNNQKLILSYPKHDSVTIPLEPELRSPADANLCSGKVCGDRIRGIDCGTYVAYWLAKVLHQPGLKLILQLNNRKMKKGRNNDSADILSLANESQYLILHRPSVRHLLEQISTKDNNEQHSEESLIQRFRSNLVVDGGLPYEEDGWRSMTLGMCTLEMSGCCRRCQMVSVVPNSEQRTKEPMLTLAQTRGSNMNFGVHAFTKEFSEIIEVGMKPIVEI